MGHDTAVKACLMIQMRAQQHRSSQRCIQGKDFKRLVNEMYQASGFETLPTQLKSSCSLIPIWMIRLHSHALVRRIRGLWVLAWYGMHIEVDCLGLDDTRHTVHDTTANKAYNILTNL